MQSKVRAKTKKLTKWQTIRAIVLSVSTIYFPDVRNLVGFASRLLSGSLKLVVIAF
jgi:hypothetical protein